ncbi:unnamed protein product [Candida verbasci]|uniref:Uncharacterized protein n=1 Tax=Candida verbasci TaxID=1227364 RepID=A0A9W4U0F3_9ASCO|nr:unnamed protein product [Candida verbasci]
MDEKVEFEFSGRKPINKKRHFLLNPYLWVASALLFIIYNLNSVIFRNDSFIINDDTKLDPKSILLDSLKTNLAGNWSHKYTTHGPHLAGTNYDLVDWTNTKFKLYGFEPTIDTYEIYVSYPKSTNLQLITEKDKVIYHPSLVEPELKEDPSSFHNNSNPVFLGYSGNGNATAEYIYANYGTKEDFEKLQHHKVDISGKIVLVRYGKILRGLKVKFAQDFGAVGVLIFTDPAEDRGNLPKHKDDYYPKLNSTARNPYAVQRGSVQFTALNPGDPTLDETQNARLGSPKDRKDPHRFTPKIPVLPISYAEVQPILKKLNGKGKQFDSFKGELKDVEYYTGPNVEYKLNLYNKQDFNITQLWNVYGEIKGEKPNEVIIIGNHRDSWNGGAGDPNSGSAVLIELARSLGELKNSGFKFKRSIVLQSYDGEEYGLLGSTEAGKYYAEKYQKDVVTYINLDTAVTGKQFKLGATPLLNEVLLKIAKELDYPNEKGQSLYDHFKSTRETIGTLGSGSDFTVTLDFLGISSIDVGFSQGKDDPVYHYHSNYDSFHWMKNFGDPGFIYHNLLSKYIALLTLELSEKEIIAFNLSDYSKSILKYFEATANEVPEEWLDKKVGEKEDEDDDDEVEQSRYIKKITQGYYQDSILSKRCQMMNQINNHKRGKKLIDLLSNTHDELKFLQNATKGYDYTSKELQKQFDIIDELPFWKKIKLHFQIKYHNKVLQYFERNFLFKNGLKNRPFFKHIVYTSGRYTGYSSQELPGLREAIEDDDFDRFVKWVNILFKTSERISKKLT